MTGVNPLVGTTSKKGFCMHEAEIQEREAGPPHPQGRSYSGSLPADIVLWGNSVQKFIGFPVSCLAPSSRRQSAVRAQKAFVGKQCSRSWETRGSGLRRQLQ